MAKIGIGIGIGYGSRVGVSSPSAPALIGGLGSRALAAPLAGDTVIAVVTPPPAAPAFAPFVMMANLNLLDLV